MASIVGMWGQEYHVFTPLKVMVHTISAPPVASFQVDPLATLSKLGLPYVTGRVQDHSVVRELACMAQDPLWRAHIAAFQSEIALGLSL